MKIVSSLNKLSFSGHLFAAVIGCLAMLVHHGAARKATTRVVARTTVNALIASRDEAAAANGDEANVMTGDITFNNFGRSSTITDPSASDNQNQTDQVLAVSGEMIISGWTDGIDPYGNANSSLDVLFSFDGCGNGSACFLVEVEDRPDFCNVTKIGDIDDDDGEGDVEVLNNVDAEDDTDSVEDGIQGSAHIDAGVGIEQLVGKSMVVQDALGRVLACALFEEIKDENITQDATTEDADTEDAATEDADTEDDPISLGEEDNTPSGANSRIGTWAVALLAFAVSSILVMARV